MESRFKIGQKISARSICDIECVFEGVIIDRTVKNVVVDIQNTISRKKIFYDDDGVEYIYALGRYSMSPIFKANK